MVRREAAAKLLAVAFSLLAVSMVTIHYASDSGVSVLKQKRSLMDKFQGAKNAVLGVRHAPPPKHTHTPTESGLPTVVRTTLTHTHTHTHTRVEEIQFAKLARTHLSQAESAPTPAHAHARTHAPVETIRFGRARPHTSTTLSARTTHAHAYAPVETIQFGRARAHAHAHAGTHAHARAHDEGIRFYESDPTPHAHYRARVRSSTALTHTHAPVEWIHVYESDHTHPANTHGAPTTTAAPSADTDPADANTDPAEASTDPAEVNTDPVEVNTDPVEVNTDPVEVNTDPVEADTAPANTGAGDGSAGAEEGREGGEDYYVSSFPSFSRKQVGPLSSMGDPVLNMNNKFVRIDDCEENDNCWDKDDKKLANWRDFKQESMSVDGTMRTQLRHAFHIAQTNLKACEEAYSFDQKSVDKCQGREARKLCYRYYSLAHACDWSESSRHNKPAGTVYWSKSLKLKACDGESKKAMDEMCKEHDKLPGVEVSHWPWQDWKMNMGRRSFTIDPLFGKALPESP